MRGRHLWFLVVCALMLQSTATYSQLRTWKFGVGISGTINQLKSDLQTDDIGAGASAGFTLSFAEHWGLRGALGMSSFTGKNSLGQEFQTNPFYAKLYLSYDILPQGTLNPFIFAGGGVLYINAVRDHSVSLISSNDTPWDIAAAGGVGVDIFPDPLWSITISAEGTLMGKDKLEGIRLNSNNDMYGQINIGFRYYFYDALFFLSQQESRSTE